MSQFRAKKLDLGCFVNAKVIRDHTKRKVFVKNEPERLDETTCFTVSFITDKTSDKHCDISSGILHSHNERELRHNCSSHRCIATQSQLR